MSAEMIPSQVKDSSAPVAPVTVLPASVSKPEATKPKAESPKVNAREYAQALASEKEKPVEEIASEAASQMNDVMDAFNKSIRFRVDDQSGQRYVQVIDRKTDEVLRTIPSEDMLEMMSRLDDMVGMIVDERG